MVDTQDIRNLLSPNTQEDEGYRERAAVSQIQKYVSEYDHLQAKTQSAYRPSHSCEDQHSCVFSSDMLMFLDKGQEVIGLLILLDYSSAFHTISHDTILQRLPQWFGIRGRALDRFRTYFTSRTQSVVIDGIQSSAHTPTCGVPQGSVIGPLIFTMYTAPLEKIIEAHGFSKMFYADDTQIYISFTASEISALLPRVTNCIREVKEWSRLNGLMLNSKKTEVLHLSSRFRSHTCSSFPPIEIDGSQVLPVKKARNLGVVFDDHFTLHEYVSSRCRSASFALFKI